MGYANKWQLLRDLEASGAYTADEIKSIGAMTATKAVEKIKERAQVSGYSDQELEDLMGQKQVLIKATEGEDVQIVPPDGEASKQEDEEDEPDPEGEPEKSVRKPSGAKAHAPGVKAFLPVTSKTATGKKAMYNRAVAEGRAWKGADPVFSDADEAEAFTAWLRFNIAGTKDYPQKRQDRDIVMGHKELSAGVNTLGGVLVPHMFEDTLIEHRAKYDAITRASPVQKMSIGQNSLPRLIDDVTMSVTGEGVTLADQNKPEFDLVEMHAKEVTGLLKITYTLLNDAAIDVASAVAGSFVRAYGKFRDRNFLLTRAASGNSPSFQGILDKIGSNSTYDATLSSSWADLTEAHIQTLMSRVSDRAFEFSERIGFIMSRPYYAAGFNRIGRSAGGNTLAMMRAGGPMSPQFDADAEWDGYPVWFTPAMPRTYTGDQLSVLFGAFDAACKVAEVVGTETLMTSEHAFWSSNHLGVKMVRRVAFNAHDVNDNPNDPDTGSMVVALKD